MATIQTNEDMVKLIRSGLELAVESMARDEIEKFIVKLEQKLKEQVGAKLIGLISSNISMERYGMDLRIEIRNQFRGD